MTNSTDWKLILESVEREIKDDVHVVLDSLDLLGDEKLTPAQCDHMHRGRSSAHHLLRILEDVAMLSSSEELTARDSRPFAPAELLRTIVEVMEPLAKRRDVSLELSAQPDATLVEADAFAFEQVITRTVEYAIRSVERGTITVSLNYSVADGEGKSIVRIALRSHEWPTPADHLTLHLAKAFAARMGATFERSLGASENSVEIAIPVKLVDAQLNSGAKPSTRILVAEDSDESFRLLEAFLQGQPCSITRAIDGVQAVAMATSGDHDIAFMDIHMPGLDGYTATNRIRDWETANCRKRMPIIVLSTEDLESQMAHGAIVGCSAYLQKPVRKTTLVMALNRYSNEMTL